MNSMTKDTTETTVRRLTAGWKFLPPVEVVRGPQALPIPAPSDAVGLFLRGSVYLVEQPLDLVPHTWAHEAVGHFGPRAVMGSATRSFWGAVQEGCRAGDPSLGRLRRHVRDTYIDATGAPCLSSLQEADEVVARMAETRIDPRTGLLFAPAARRARILAALRHFARERLLLNLPACSSEVLGALLHAQDRLRRGRPFWDFGGWCYSGVMSSKPMGPSRPAVDLEESLEMYRAASSRIELSWKHRLQIWGWSLALIAFLIYLLVAVFSTTIWFAGPAAGIVAGLIFLWFFFRQD